MSWVLGWLLGGSGSSGGGSPPVEPPTPIEGEITRDSPEYFDHVSRALTRICQMFKPESTRQ